MAISTHRLLIIVITMNLLMAIAGAMYETPRIVDYSVFSETTEIGSNIKSEFEGENQQIISSQLQEEGSPLNIFTTGWVLIKLFFKGFVMFPIDESGLGGGLDKIVYTLLLIFKALMYGLIALEVFLLIKNKKS